jgi:hypothetical protein
MAQIADRCANKFILPIVSGSVRQSFMQEYILRFLIGGFAVSLFAVFGDVFRPKSFAGLFGAAPSIALSTLAIAYSQQGAAYVASEGRSMIMGAGALLIYCVCVIQLMKHLRFPAWAATSLSLLPWVLVALGLERLLVGQ